MASANQIKAGIGDYISNNVMPKMDSKRQFMLGVAYGLLAGRMDAIVTSFQNNTAIKAIGIIDENGEIDVGAIYNAAIAQIQRQNKLTLDIPLLGTFAFDIDDIRAIYEAIEGRANT